MYIFYKCVNSCYNIMTSTTNNCRIISNPFDQGGLPLCWLFYFSNIIKFVYNYSLPVYYATYSTTYFRSSHYYIAISLRIHGMNLKLNIKTYMLFKHVYVSK